MCRVIQRSGTKLHYIHCALKSVSVCLIYSILKKYSICLGWKCTHEHFLLFLLKRVSDSSTPLTCFRDSGLVGGSRGRPGDHLKFMKAPVCGTHEVIGSIIKEVHVTPHQVALWMLFLFVWTIIKLFDVTTSVSNPLFSPGIQWCHLPTFITF